MGYCNNGNIVVGYARANSDPLEKVGDFLKAKFDFNTATWTADIFVNDALQDAPGSFLTSNILSYDHAIIQYLTSEVI